MPSRDDQLQSLRPRIPTLIEERGISSAERFQNLSLRPILKLQQELLLHIFRHHLHKRKGSYYELSPARRSAYIRDCLQRDQQLRNLMCGCIIGQFTLAEWMAYVDGEAELKRRLVGMLIERIRDGMGEE